MAGRVTASSAASAQGEVRPDIGGNMGGIPGNGKRMILRAVGDNTRARPPPRPVHILPPEPMSSFAPITQYPALACAAMLTVSNLFMTFAWYGHLKNLQSKPWWIAALVSWLIALAEYLFQVPANRIGYTTMSLAQL